jgi:integration host factor subunit alpha
LPLSSDNADAALPCKENPKPISISRQDLTMTLTKAHLIDALHERFGFTKPKSTDMLNTVLESIKDALENGEDVLISGFGKFCVKDKHDRRGRNPQTGQDLMLGARRVVTFKCSSVLRDKHNSTP